MEQPPNMMPNSMQMQMQNMNSMQRPQSGNMWQQIHAKVLDDLKRNNKPLPHGWQTTFDPAQRAIQVVHIISALRLLHQDAQRCVAIAENFEEKSIQESATKEEYLQRIAVKLNEIKTHRANSLQQNAQNGQLGLPMNMQNNNNNNNMGNGNMGMNMMQNPGMSAMGMNLNGNMNMNMGMGGNMNLNQGQGMDLSNMGMAMPNGQMAINGQQQNQSFPAQLQRQMQPSPLPQQLQALQQSNTMDPAALRNPQMQPQMPNMNQQAPNSNQGGQSQLLQPTQDEIRAKMRQLFAQLPEDRKQTMRNQAYAGMNDQQRREAEANGPDPVNRIVFMKARELVTKEKNNIFPSGQQMGNSMSMQNPVQNSMGMTANSLQQTSQPDFSTITGLQANAIKSQESGGEVVPASNHQPFNVAGQMNMPQGVNPQMLGNPNNQAGNNANMQQQMKMAQLQRQQQQQQQLQKDQQQNLLAQRQAAMAAQQAQNHLRGQPGGLSTPNALNGGQVNSPAMNMSMLNRPMAPPGQGTPSTPQQPRPAQGMPQTPVNAANQLAHHHQSMLNQSQNSQQKNIERLIASLPPDQRERISALPASEIPAFLTRYVAQQRTANSPQNMTNMAKNSNMGAPQQQMMGNGLPQNVGNAIPNFTSQPPPNQQQPRQVPDPMAMQKMHQQNIDIRRRAFDAFPYPKHILSTIGIQVDPTTDTWLKLKQFISANPTVLPPNTMDKLLQQQHNWYETHPEEAAKAMENFSQKMQAVQQHNAQRQRQQQFQQHQQQQQQTQQQQQQQSQSHTVQAPSSMPMPNGQAPPAQMVPPTAPMQQPTNQKMNMNFGQGQLVPPQIPNPTDAEVKMFREKNPQPTSQYNDEAIRTIIMKTRRQNFIKNAQQMRVANQGQPGNMPQGDQQQPARTQQGQNPQMTATAQGQKLPQNSNDDVIEIMNPSAPAMNNMPQPPQMQQTPSQQAHFPPLGNRTLSPEELNRLTPQQRQAYSQQLSQRMALRKAQLATAGSQNPPSGQTSAQQQPAQQQTQGFQNQSQDPTSDHARAQQDGQKIQQMWAEVSTGTPRGNAVQSSPEELKQAQAILKKLYPSMGKLHLTYKTALYMPTLGEERLRQVMQIKVKLLHNVKDSSGTIQDVPSVSLADLKNYERFLGNYFGQLSNFQKKNRMQQQGQAGTNGAQAQQAQTQQAQLPPQAIKQEAAQQAPPPNSKVSQTGHNRKQSASTKAPPAPTDEKKFDWVTGVGVNSPHGIPKYETGRTELTPDKLKFPASKKRKTGGQSESQSSTPAGQTGTPNGNATSPGVPATKAPTPEQMRRMQAQVKPVEPVRPKIRCDDPQCESSITGFESEDALKQHNEAEHQPIEDPFKFLMDTTEEFVEGQKSKVVPAAPKAQMQARGKPAAVDKTKQKSASGTPAPLGRAAIKPASTPAGKQIGDVQPAVVPAAAEEKTLLESMAQKINFDLPTSHPEATDALPSYLSDEVWMDKINSAYMNSDSFAGPFDGMHGVSDWNLLFDSDSSSDLTPSSADSQSTHDSDISRTAQLAINMQWDPFGNGDTGVPEFLAQGLGGLNVDGPGASAQAGTELAGEDGRQKDDVMDWATDVVDWDAIFGVGNEMGEI